MTYEPILYSASGPSTVNHAPSLNSGPAASFAENGTGAAYTVTATDPDANTILSYALAGTDAALFNINTSTGVVTFKTAPNFEAPADAGANNVYNIAVTASDGALTTAAQAVAITVNNVNEAPTSTTITPTVAVVNQAYSYNTSGNFSDVDAGNIFSYSATGLPNGLSIDTATGIISGTALVNAIPSVTVTATDSGGLATSQTFNLSVISPLSAPTISSHIDNVSNVEVTSNIVLTSTENVTAVAGKYIHIINDANDANHAGFHGESITNTQDILVTSDAVTIINNTININPGFDLDFGNNYHITVDAGAFLGVTSGQGSAATLDASAMNFGTVLPSASASVATSSQAMTNGTDAMVAGHNWFDAEGHGTPGGVAVGYDFASGNFAIAANDLATTGIATNDFYVAVNNFAAGDLIYVDNHGDNSVQRQGDFNNGMIVDYGIAPTQITTAANGGLTGTSGGQFDVTLEGSASSFSDTIALQVLLGSVAYEPILYG